MAVAGAIVALAAPGAMASASKVQLGGSAAPAASRTEKVGSVSGSNTISFEVAMKLKNAAAAAQLATAVSTPGNAQYGKFLTANQWEARFSPSTADVAKVSAYLRQNGFKVLGASADRLAIRASGTVSQIERVFSTSLATYNVAGHKLRLAERNLSVPNSIASAVLGFPGITQTVARPDSTTGAAKPNDPPPPPGSFDPPPGFRAAPPCGAFYSDKVDTVLPPYGNGYPPNPFWAVCGYKPPQFRSAYNLSGPDDGTSVTVGIVDAYAAPTILVRRADVRLDQRSGQPAAGRPSSASTTPARTPTQRPAARMAGSARRRSTSKRFTPPLPARTSSTPARRTASHGR